MRARAAVPPPGKRSNGYLFCQTCRRSWAYLGLPETETWPTHRCGREVRVFDSFLSEDPNKVPLPAGIKL